MANIRFYYDNKWDTATLAASSAATNYPATNTQQRWKRRTWNATGDTIEYIRTTGGSAVSADAFFIFYHNITAGGTVTVKGSDNNWVGSTTIGVMSRTAAALVLVPGATQTYNDYGFFIADAANPDGYVKLGRIWYGVPWQPAYGYNPKAIEVCIDPSLVMTSTHGAKSTLEKSKYKTWSLPFDAVNNANFCSFFNTVGTSKPFVILKKPTGYQGADYPTPEAYSYYVSATKAAPTGQTGGVLKVAMTLEEER